MRCARCYGSGLIINPEVIEVVRGERAIAGQKLSDQPLTVPCPECLGGIAHCCDGHDGNEVERPR